MRSCPRSACGSLASTLHTACSAEGRAVPFWTGFFVWFENVRSSRRLAQTGRHQPHVDAKRRDRCALSLCRIMGLTTGRPHCLPMKRHSDTEDSAECTRRLSAGQGAEGPGQSAQEAAASAQGCPGPVKAVVWCVVCACPALAVPPGLGPCGRDMGRCPRWRVGGVCRGHQGQG